MIEEFVLTLPLKVETWQADILNNRYEHLRHIYNMVQRKLLRHPKIRNYHPIHD